MNNKILPKGSIVKIYGIPMKTLNSVLVETSDSNWSIIESRRLVKGEDFMDNQEILKEVKDTLAKVQGAINLLKDGKQILVSRKLFGIQQKLSALLTKIDPNCKVEIVPDEDCCDK